MAINHQEEALLVRKAQRGDRDALGTLWDRVTPKLFGYLVNVTRDKTVAEDILQSTWLRAIDALPRFQERGIRIEAWLFAIARNECRTHWRASKKEVAFDPVEHDKVGDNRQEIHDKLLVEKMLALLSEDDREILHLRYIADLAPNDIAHLLHINFVAVRVRLHRATARARAALSSTL